MAAPHYIMMPTSFKVFLTCLAVFFYGGFGVYNLDNGAVGWVVIVTAAFFALGIWIFPDNPEIKAASKPDEAEAQAQASENSHEKLMAPEQLGIKKP